MPVERIVPQRAPISRRSGTGKRTLCLCARNCPEFLDSAFGSSADAEAPPGVGGAPSCLCPPRRSAEPVAGRAVLDGKPDPATPRSERGHQTKLSRPAGNRAILTLCHACLHHAPLAAPRCPPRVLRYVMVLSGVHNARTRILRGLPALARAEPGAAGLQHLATSGRTPRGVPGGTGDRQLAPNGRTVK